MEDMETLKKVADKINQRTMQMDLTWEWGAGVAYYGICRIYEVTGDKSVLENLKERIDKLIDLGLPKDWTVNTCAMGHCLITLYEVYGEEKYWDLVESKIDYLTHRALRFGPSVLQHTVSSNNDFPEQVWADTLFMAAFFMLRVGIIKSNQELISDALNQYHWHIAYLQDTETGLFYHGYDNTKDNHLSGLYWARANAWAAYTMSQVGARLKQAYLYPEFINIAGSLDEQLSALKLYQTENGLWHTIIDDLDSYEELSASCGILGAMVVKNNPLHKEYIEKGLKGVLENISPSGKVLNVSGGTAVMNDLAGYREIPKTWIQGWGQGLALAFLGELMKNGQKKEAERKVLSLEK